MTPKEIEGRRYWTPRLLTANNVLTAGSVVLWFFVSTWVLDIKKSIQDDHFEVQNIEALMADRHVAGAIWKTAMEDKVQYIEVRLARVEKKVSPDSD